MESLRLRYFLSLFTILLLAGCSEEKKEAAPVKVEEEIAETPVIEFTVKDTLAHDTTCYTEGFLFHQGKLYESTGAPSHIRYTHSSVGVVDQKTGKFDKKISLDKGEYFGEGIAVLNTKLYMLTYTNQVCFIYDLATFNRVGQFGYSNKEGWGMTTDGTNLIFSDGSCNLTVVDPQTFRTINTIVVTENTYGVYALNELEFINGFIYANIWMTNRIVKIDPKTGKVVGALDLSRLTDAILKRGKHLNELNGIAYDSKTDRILVTGKLWPKIFEINFPH